jgi:hypothetical protein
LPDWFRPEHAEASPAEAKQVMVFARKDGVQAWKFRLLKHSL